MQTTLRIDDSLYREAKAEAARAGLTLTRLLEEGLRLRLENRPRSGGAGAQFRVYDGGACGGRTWEEILHVAEEAQERYDLNKLGIMPPTR